SLEIPDFPVNEVATGIGGCLRPASASPGTLTDAAARRFGHRLEPAMTIRMPSITCGPLSFRLLDRALYSTTPASPTHLVALVRSQGTSVQTRPSSLMEITQC